MYIHTYKYIYIYIHICIYGPLRPDASACPPPPRLPHNRIAYCMNEIMQATYNKFYEVFWI